MSTSLIPRERWIIALILALLAFAWGSAVTGLVSSNDGSHLALARALGLRGEARIDPDRALTLEVDLAERDGHAYSDRPPGTAFSALLAARIGDRLDGRMLERAREQARAGETVRPLPACEPYILTYAKRSPGAPPLAMRIGSAIAACLHALLLGVIGLALLARVLALLDATLSARAFALVCLGAATLWGPYATTLYSHGAATLAVVAWLYAALSLGLARGTTLASGAATQTATRASALALLAGLAGAWAIACDYLLLLAIVPASLLAIDRRHWAFVLLGTLPLVVATLAYHQAAFGSPFAVGYDFHGNFEFARERSTTFSSNPLEGLWILLGLGRDAGLLARSPISLMGLIGLIVLLARRGPPSWALAEPERQLLARALLGFVPWMLALAMHETPWGGGSEDHRYLIPLLPFVGVGLALGWDRSSWLVRVAALALAAVSALLVWRGFLSSHAGSLLTNPGLGLGCALLVLAFAILPWPAVARSGHKSAA